MVNDDFTMRRCWWNGERVHWFYLGLCARRTCNFIFQQSVRILSAIPKILCACNIFLLMSLGVGAIEQLSHPLYTLVPHSVHTCTFIWSPQPYNNGFWTFNKMSIHLYTWWCSLESFLHTIWTTVSHSFSRRIFNNQNQAWSLPQCTLGKIHFEKHPNMSQSVICFCDIASVSAIDIH